MFVAAEPHRARDDTRPLDAFTLATPGLVSSIFAHSRQDADERQNQPFVSSSLRALFLAENLQPSSFHALPHSFARRKNVTPTFQVTSPLLPRSLAQERKSTPLLSCACALFREKGGGVPVPFPKRRSLECEPCRRNWHRAPLHGDGG